MTQYAEINFMSRVAGSHEDCRYLENNKLAVCIEEKMNFCEKTVMASLNIDTQSQVTVEIQFMVDDHYRLEFSYNLNESPDTDHIRHIELHRECAHREHGEFRSIYEFAHCTNDLESLYNAVEAYFGVLTDLRLKQKSEQPSTA